MYGLPVSAKHFLALCELYNPDSNTFLTRQGELGLALHEMHRISGLPMGQMLYQEYFPSNHELSQLKDRMPDRYETLWDLTCHYHIALVQSEPLAKRTKSHVSLKQFTCYLFRNLESNSGEAICELAMLTPSEVNVLLKKIDAHSYTISSPESGFPAGTKFKSFLWHATASIQPMTLLAGYLAIWLKKCVAPYQSGDIMPLEVLYLVVQLAYKKELSLLPVMVANIHRGLRQISSTFTQKEDALSAKIPLSKVELPYTYLMAWFVLHRPNVMSVSSTVDRSVPLLQLFENGRWEGRGFPDIRKQLQRTRSKTRRIDKEGKKIFHSVDDASGGDLEDYEDCFERGTAADKDEEFRHFSQARPSIAILAARRKRLAHKLHADSRASEMDLSSDDPASDGGERGDSEMSPDPAPHDCVFSGEPNSPYQVEKLAEATDVRETINVGPDLANPDTLQEANVDLGNREANTPIRDFSTDDFDEEGLLVDTPMLHFMYGSPRIDDQMPEDMFPESTLPKNPEDGPSEGTCLFSS
ncbi:uncharacterized protein A4U43_C02F15480 [Asparagus officinalis]|uniref:Aminotransferase-like plant mobile domain-containing protein n=1 Tax=Asparagus officinalis TaxID=4686 RepID=A0A5P1FNI4_ASPOF|nr:uncharacterized protein A4U43_C02F15480 [Asparagus officinalis]